MVAQLGPRQRWVLEHLAAAARDCPSRPWIPLSQLAAEHAGGPPSRREVDALRHACLRLARAGLIETSYCWLEAQQERMAPQWLRRETITRRRHLCVRLALDLDPSQQARCEPDRSQHDAGSVRPGERGSTGVEGGIRAIPPSAE
ncbi:MAG: hypothetical protein M3133_05785 [Actinomycetota bacterium]|nr:hypothetical protein [Actinomycetota bacterium]